MITQEQLRELADKWGEPDWTPKKRIPTCADCGANTVKPWHCWLKDDKFWKELHLCPKCGRKYGL